MDDQRTDRKGGRVLRDSYRENPKHVRLRFGLKSLIALIAMIAVAAGAYEIGRKNAYQEGYRDGKAHAAAMTSSGSIKNPLPGYIPIQ